MKKYILYVIIAFSLIGCTNSSKTIQLYQTGINELILNPVFHIIAIKENKEEKEEYFETIRSDFYHFTKEDMQYYASLNKVEANFYHYYNEDQLFIGYQDKDDIYLVDTQIYTNEEIKKMAFPFPIIEKDDVKNAGKRNQEYYVSLKPSYIEKMKFDPEMPKVELKEYTIYFQYKESKLENIKTVIILANEDYWLEQTSEYDIYISQHDIPLNKPVYVK